MATDRTVHETNDFLIFSGEFFHGNLSSIGPPPVGVDLIANDVTGDASVCLGREGVSVGEVFKANGEPLFSFFVCCVEGSQSIGGFGVEFWVKEDSVDNWIV